MKTVQMGCMMSASMFIAVVFVYMGIGRTSSRQKIKDLNLGGMRTNGCTPTVGKRMQCVGLLDCGCKPAQALTSSYFVDANLTWAHRGCKRLQEVQTGAFYTVLCCHQGQQHERLTQLSAAASVERSLSMWR